MVTTIILILSRSRGGHSPVGKRIEVYIKISDERMAAIKEAVFKEAKKHYPDRNFKIADITPHNYCEKNFTAFEIFLTCIEPSGIINPEKGIHISGDIRNNDGQIYLARWKDNILDCRQHQIVHF